MPDDNVTPIRPIPPVDFGARTEAERIAKVTQALIDLAAEAGCETYFDDDGSLTIWHPVYPMHP